VAGVSRIDVDGRLWRVRARLHCRHHVSGSGTSDQNAPITFDLLSSTAANGLIRGNHPVIVVGFFALHAWSNQRFFCGSTAAVDPGVLRNRHLDPLRGDFARPVPSPAWAETGGGALHHWIYRCANIALGDQLYCTDPRAMKLFCVGLSHHTTSVETRERFAGHAGTHCVLRNFGCAEAVVLNTCNRVEVYGAGETIVPTDKVARCLARRLDSELESVAAFYRYDDSECAQHLFRVTSGLDSMVVGETEILGQTKRAYESARASGAAGPYLHRLFQRAFRVAKHVRTHTEITRGQVSVGSVAVDLAEKIFGNLAQCKVLLLGAGETGERTARALVSRGVSDLRVSNRSAGRAETLARHVASRVVDFDEWLEQCREIDILVAATSSEAPLLTRDNLVPMLRDRVDRPLFIIDIAVPRDVDPSVNEFEGVYVYDIDSLQSIAEQSLALRRQQVSAAEAIIAEHVTEFTNSISRGLKRALQTSDPPSLGENPLRISEQL
jgi:glutamyl-tRNA reductase